MKKLDRINELVDELNELKLSNCKFQSIGASIPELAVHLF